MSTQTQTENRLPPQNGAAKASPLKIMGERYNIDPNTLYEVLTKTILRPTEKHVPTKEEVAAFVIVANQYGLNPFTREIHAFVDTRRGGLVPIVGVDGWVTLLNRQPNFDGVDFAETVDKDGKPYAMTCMIYHKNRAHPVSVTEYFSECYRPTDPWKSMPRRMLRHKALIQSSRVAFGFSGIYDEDEAADIIGREDERPAAPPVGRQSIRKPAAIAAQPLPMPAHFEQRQAEAVQQPLPKPAVVVQEQLAEGEVDPAEELRERVREAGRKLKFTPEKWSNLLSFFQVRTIDRLTAQQCESMLLQLEEMMERDAQGGEERTDF